MIQHSQRGQVVSNGVPDGSGRARVPPPDRSHPLGCHRPRVPDRLCLWAILIRLVTGASWVDVEAILDHRVSDTTLRVGVTSGSPPACSNSSSPRRWLPSTASSSSTWATSASTARCTRRPTPVREPARTPLIEGSWAGSGRWPRNVTASPSAGRSTAPTATTSACSMTPSPPSPTPACSPTSTRCA